MSPVCSLFVLVSCCFLGSWAQDGSVIQYQITEEEVNSKPIGNAVTDAKLSEQYSVEVLPKLRFSIIGDDENGGSLFTVNEVNGDVHTKRTIDREAICPGKDECLTEFDIAVSPVEHFQIITVTVTIIDINDNTPQFPSDDYLLKISESSAEGSKFVLPLARDLDSQSYGIHSYRLSPPSSVFDLEQSTNIQGLAEVHLVLLKAVDREDKSSYQLRLEAIDGGSPPNIGSMAIDIEVEDANDHAPIFDNTTYVVTYREDTPQGAELIQVKATDQDIGDNGHITYSLTSASESDFGSQFRVNGTTGQIFLKAPLDFESTEQYHLSIMAQDGGPYSQPAYTNVIINVLDVNDNAPEIKINMIKPGDGPSVVEESDPGTLVVLIFVSDPDSGQSGEGECSLSDDHFELQPLHNPSQYKLVTKAKFDREERDAYNVTIVCLDNGQPSKVSHTSLIIQILDINDNLPIFSQPSYSALVNENNKMNAYVTQVNATDRDVGNNGDILFSISGAEQSLFDIHPTSGVIRATTRFDYESVKTINLNVVASDQGTPVGSSTVSVTVKILDANDETPKFEREEYNFGVFENKPKGTEVGSVSAKDADSPPFDEFEFTISGFSSGQFAIDKVTGLITTKQSMDREKVAVHHIPITVTNLAPPRLSSSVTATIYLADENDNTPIFLFPNAENNTVTISNRAPVGFQIVKVRATDKDKGVNAMLNFSIADGNKDSYFGMDSLTGAVSVRRDLGSIKLQTFSLVVLVQDQGDAPKMAMNILNIDVNASLAYGGIPSPVMPAPGAGSTNMTIVIAVVAVSSVLIVILLAAIILVKCADRRKRNQKYQHQYVYTVEPSDNAPKMDTLIVSDEKEQLAKEGRRNSKSSYTNKAMHKDLDSSASASAAGKSAEGQNWPHLMVERPYMENKDGGQDNASFRSEHSTDSGRGASEEGENLNNSISAVAGAANHQKTPTGGKRYQANLAVPNSKPHGQRSQQDKMKKCYSGPYRQKKPCTNKRTSSLALDLAEPHHNPPTDSSVAQDYLKYNKQRQDNFFNVVNDAPARHTRDDRGHRSPDARLPPRDYQDSPRYHDNHERYHGDHHSRHGDMGSRAHYAQSSMDSSALGHGSQDGSQYWNEWEEEDVLRLEDRGAECSKDVYV